MTEIPPAQTASTACNACFEDEARTTGMMAITAIRFAHSSFVTPLPTALPHDPCPCTLHHLSDFFEGNHTGIAGRGHCQCAMGGTTLDRPLRIPAAEKTVDQAGGKRIAAAHAIEDFQAFPVFRFVEA